MKPWKSEQGVFGAGDADASNQENNPSTPHPQDVVKESPSGDDVMVSSGDKGEK